MEELTTLFDRWQQLFIAFATQENLTVLGIGLLSVGLIGLLIWIFTPGKRGVEEMARRPIDYRRVHVQLSKSEKKIVTAMAEDYLEEQVLMRKMKRETARQLYEKLGLAFEIDDLIPPGVTKARQKSLEKHLNGHKPNIPGEKPIQDIKPNNLPTIRSTKDKLKNLFKPATT